MYLIGFTEHKHASQKVNITSISLQYQQLTRLSRRGKYISLKFTSLQIQKTLTITTRLTSTYIDMYETLKVAKMQNANKPKLVWLVRSAIRTRQ